MSKIVTKIVIILVLVSSPAHAGIEKFFGDIKGEWFGNGEIIAGKYQNTRFQCSLKGIATLKTAMEVTGKCRVGPFSQPITAKIKQTKNGEIKGEFLEGINEDGVGNGINIISGKLKGNKLIVQLNRKKLDGAMVTNLKDQNTIEVSISVKLKGQLIPIIGLTLNRKDDLASDS